MFMENRLELNHVLHLSLNIILTLIKFQYKTIKQYLHVIHFPFHNQCHFAQEHTWYLEQQIIFEKDLQSLWQYSE